MNPSYDKNTVEVLREMFADFDMKFQTIQFPVTVSAFFFTFASAAALQENWEKMQKAIAGYYQTGLADEAEFERWNIYIFYLCRELVASELKYKIQNDKFSSRKVVVEDFAAAIDEETLNELIAEHITNTDLIDADSFVGDGEKRSKKKYASDSSIWKIIGSAALPKEKDTAAVDKLLAQIEKQVTKR
jgi:hypothetical protein